MLIYLLCSLLCSAAHVDDGEAGRRCFEGLVITIHRSLRSLAINSRYRIGVLRRIEIDRLLHASGTHRLAHLDFQVGCGVRSATMKHSYNDANSPDPEFE